MSFIICVWGLALMYLVSCTECSTGARLECAILKELISLWKAQVILSVYFVITVVIYYDFIKGAESRKPRLEYIV